MASGIMKKGPRIFCSEVPGWAASSRPYSNFGMNTAKGFVMLYKTDGPAFAGSSGSRLVIPSELRDSLIKLFKGDTRSLLFDSGNIKGSQSLDSWVAIGLGKDGNEDGLAFYFTKAHESDKTSSMSIFISLRSNRVSFTFSKQDSDPGLEMSDRFSLIDPKLQSATYSSLTLSEIQDSDAARRTIFENLTRWMGEMKAKCRLRLSAEQENALRDLIIFLDKYATEKYGPPRDITRFLTVVY